MRTASILKDSGEDGKICEEKKDPITQICEVLSNKVPIIDQSDDTHRLIGPLFVKPQSRRLIGGVTSLVEA